MRLIDEIIGAILLIESDPELQYRNTLELFVGDFKDDNLHTNQGLVTEGAFCRFGSPDGACVPFLGDPKGIIPSRRKGIAARGYQKGLKP